MGTPVTVIVAYDLKFYDKLPRLFPRYPAMHDTFGNNPQLIGYDSKRVVGGPGGSGTTHPAEARTLCGAAGLIGPDTSVDWTLAAVIIAELGADRSVFGSVSQLASWAGVCPGNLQPAVDP